MRFGLRFGLAHPMLALELALRRITQEQAFARVLAAALPGVVARYGTARARGETSLALPPTSLQRTIVRLAGPSRDPLPMAVTPWTAFLYLATREIRPKVIVETGVWYGWSSAALLQALHDNGEGKLISVDLPPAQHRAEWKGGHEVQCSLMSPTHSVGSSVPPGLRDRWELRLGDALAVLPEVLARERAISMFVHDSLHTYDHMTAEYTIGYGALEEGGLLVSDDIGMNEAWSDFTRAKALDGRQLAKGRDGSQPFGYARKGRTSGGPAT